MILNNKKRILLYILMALATQGQGKNLGVVGEVYPIQEPSFIEEIKEEAAKAAETMNLEMWQSDFQQGFDRPSPVLLSEVKKAKSWFFDPSVRVSHDVLDSNSRLIVPAGTKVNPLASSSLGSPLFFYNADVSEEVLLAKKINHELHDNVTLILVGGSVHQQEKEFQRIVYFDQEGKICRRLGIEMVPVLISQAGLRLKIEELVP